MAENHLKKIRLLGKLEEISAVAHQKDFFTNTGLSVHYKPSQPPASPDLQELVYTALEAVIRLHPILFAVPVVTDTKESYWGRLPSIDIKQVVSFVGRSLPSKVDVEGRDRELDTLLEKQHNTSFKSGYGTYPVWRLIILRDLGVHHQFTACFIAHHAIGDGTSLQIFQNSFQIALCEASSSTLQRRAEHIILSNDNDPIAPSLEELHPLPIPVNPLNDITEASNGVEWQRCLNTLQDAIRVTIVGAALRQILALKCRTNKIAPNGCSTICSRQPALQKPSANRRLPNVQHPGQFARRSSPKAVDGVMGDFIDAFKVKLHRSDLYSSNSNDSNISDPSSSSNSVTIWNHARKIQEATRRYFANTSPSGEPYTNVAIFKLVPDLGAALDATLGQPRGESFEVSNLGTFSQPKILKIGSGPAWRAGNVVLSRCAYAAGGPLVVCVLSSEDNIGFGFTWQEGAVADDIVENVINGVRAHFDHPN